VVRKAGVQGAEEERLEASILNNLGDIRATARSGRIRINRRHSRRPSYTVDTPQLGSKATERAFLDSRGKFQWAQQGRRSCRVERTSLTPSEWQTIRPFQPAARNVSREEETCPRNRENAPDGNAVALIVDPSSQLKKERERILTRSAPGLFPKGNMRGRQRAGRTKDNPGSEFPSTSTSLSKRRSAVARLSRKPASGA